jgi:hypothetical protein
VTTGGLYKNRFGGIYRTAREATENQKTYGISVINFGVDPLATLCKMAFQIGEVSRFLDLPRQIEEPPSVALLLETLSALVSRHCTSKSPNPQDNNCKFQ